MRPFVLSEKDILDNISAVLQGLDGDEVAELHNNLHFKKIRYIEDSQWEYTEEED